MDLLRAWIEEENDDTTQAFLRSRAFSLLERMADHAEGEEWECDETERSMEDKLYDILVPHVDEDLEALRMA